jgi:peptidoglycan hydrolase CwlO-like protein
MQDRLDDLRSQLNASNAALEQANAANAEATAERTRLLDDARVERESLHGAIERLTGQLETAAKAQADALQKATSNAEAQVQAQGETMRLRSEIDAMRKRSLWERIRNRT